MIIPPLTPSTTISVDPTSHPKRQIAATGPTTVADKISISQAAQEKLANDKSSETGFTGFKGSIEHLEHLMATDERFAALMNKNDRTSLELGYMASVTGLPHALSHLSPKEVAMHDELIEKGNQNAALGLQHISGIRSGIILGPSLSYDPSGKEITPDNIRDYFSQSITDKSGVTQRHFEALASYLDQKQFNVEETI